MATEPSSSSQDQAVKGRKISTIFQCKHTMLPSEEVGMCVCVCVCETTLLDLAYLC